MPQELVQQVPLMRRVLESMEIPVYSREGLEADDILGTFAKRSAAQGMEVALVSGDRDLLQIADQTICIRIPKTRGGQTVTESYYAEDVLDVYGVTPLQFIDVKALMGDASDNIPGVPKVGEKTAISLIREFGSLDGVYENLDQITKPALKKSLSENEESARMSKYLATIVTDADITLDLDKAAVHDFYTKEAYGIFAELNFGAYLKRFDAGKTGQQEQNNAVILKASSGEAAENVQRVLNGMEEGHRAAISIIADNGMIKGFALVSDDVCAFILNDTDDIKILSGFLGSLRRKAKALASADPSRYDPVLALFGIKSAFPYLEIDRDAEFAEGIQLDGMLDAHLAAYLIDPVRNDHTPQSLAMELMEGRNRCRSSCSERHPSTLRSTKSRKKQLLIPAGSQKPYWTLRKN